MRLLHVEQLELVEFRGDNIPAYVIASHRWYEGSEVTFQDVQNGLNTDKDGYKKIQSFAKYIRYRIPSIKWLWIDTCCINKESSAELSEAINSMFRWYRKAEVCLAYLADISVIDGNTFDRSEWFRRGWTLQELLAPRTVIFLAKSWDVVGNKGALRHKFNGTSVGPSLESAISTATGIPEQILHDYDTSRSLSNDEKMNWITNRCTSREEDMSYALYGICGVTPGANYGEGCEGARQRLQAALNFQDNMASQKAEQFRKILDWLSPPNPWANHQSACRQRQDGTGVWLLKSGDYIAWKSGTTRHLWLHGKAGCGKTVLCSTAVEDVRSHCENARNCAYAIFYFSFSEERQRRYEDLLISLVAQLGCQEPGLSMLQREYESLNRQIPVQDDLEKIVFSSIASHDEVFLLVDALDESPEDNNVRQDVLNGLSRLEQKASNLKFLATSRSLPEIRESMVRLGVKSMLVDTQSVNQDIQSYVKQTILGDSRMSSLDQSKKLLIEETISAKADGMFRWAYCQLQELRNLQSTRPSSIMRALSAMPNTLDETYERMLARIDKQSQEDALKLLRWIAYARSPPSLAELVQVCLIDPTDDGGVDVEDRPGIEDPLKILSGLVMIDQDQEYNDDQFDDYPQHIVSGPKIRLAHFSVKEYLESDRISTSSVQYFRLKGPRDHKILTRSCLAYLTHYSSSDAKEAKVSDTIEFAEVYYPDETSTVNALGPLPDFGYAAMTPTMKDLAAFPLLRYAATSWHLHSALQEAGDVEAEVRFLSSPNVLHDWLLVGDPERSWGMDQKSPKHRGQGLYYASCLGLERVADELLSSGFDVNAVGGSYGTPLCAATVKGYEGLVKMLIGAGADINAYGPGTGSTALHIASEQGYDSIVQMLISAGADINARNLKFIFPGLHVASEQGYDSIIEMPIRAKADTNALNPKTGLTALYIAFERGYKSIVQMLISAGADINARDSKTGSTALYIAASRQDYSGIVRMLISAGADINARDLKSGSTALYAASWRGYDGIVKMLIDNGAQVNIQNRWGCHALREASLEGHKNIVQMLINTPTSSEARCDALVAASKKGYLEIVQMLIDSGADSNIRSLYENVTALEVASATGHEKIVRTLIAKTCVQDMTYSNALLAASRGGYKNIVEILINAGGDFNARGEIYNSALCEASFAGHKNVVRELIDRGADINAWGRGDADVLQAASIVGHTGVVQKLIEAGANDYSSSAKYGNALNAASFGGYLDIVEMLLAKGADIDAMPNGRRPAIQLASLRGHKEVVEALMHAGADIEVQSTKYGTTLQEASYNGSTEIVKILIHGGANVNAQGGVYGNALQAAVAMRRTSTTRILLDAKAEVNARGGKYGTALNAAVCRGYADLVELLIGAGADVHAVFTAHHPSVTPKDREEIRQMLIDAGAGIDRNKGCNNVV